MTKQQIKYRTDYMAFHASINSTDPAYQMLVEDAARIAELEAEIERLRNRDGNSTINLCFSKKGNPFNQEQLKIVDFGVSDNIYVVEPNGYIAELEADCKAMAKSQTILHRCTHSGEPETCLLDRGESCGYDNRFSGECPEFGKCTCHACTIAAKYVEGK